MGGASDLPGFAPTLAFGYALRMPRPTSRPPAQPLGVLAALAVLATVGAILAHACRKMLAAARRLPRRLPRLPAYLLAATALACVWGTGCTPAARSTAATVLTDVGAAAPLICQIPGTGGASVCGTDVAVVSDVARLIAGILAALPPAKMPPAKRADGVSGIRYRGCTIVLPAGVDVAQVIAGLP